MSVDDEDGCTASKVDKSFSLGEIMCAMRYHEFDCEE